MIFFFDENISYRAVQILEIFDRENEVRAHKDHFEPSTPDIDWLVQVSGWDTKPVVVCGDGRILSRQSERLVLRDCALVFVFLAKGWTNESWHNFAWKIVKVWPDIVRNVSHTRQPAIFEVNCGSLKVERRGLISDIRG